MSPFSTGTEVPDARVGITVGAVALIAPWAAAHWLGIADDLDALLRLLGPLRYPALAALYAGSFVVAAGAFRALLSLRGRSAFDGSKIIDSVARCLRAAAGAAFALVRSWLLPCEVYVGEMLMRIAEERALWRQYRAEFRAVYPSFAAFKRAFRGEDAPEAKQERSEPDALAAAFALLGLHADCGRKEFEARYRALMKGVHPDLVGENGMAAQLNDARAVIRARKGWK